MKKKSATSVSKKKSFTVTGTVIDQSGNALTGLTVRAYSKSIRSSQLLGEATTDEKGKYSIGYSPKKPSAAAILLKLYNGNDLLNESEAMQDMNGKLEVDITLSNGQLSNVPEFDSLVKTVAAFAEDIPLSEITETNDHRDISFIVEKSRLPRDLVEKLAMASRYSSFSPIPDYAWYGMLRQTLPNAGLNGAPVSSASIDFELKLNASFDVLMHTSVDVLINCIQRSINEKIIGNSVVAELSKIRTQLEKQVLDYAREHPVTGEPSTLYQKAQLGGLKGKELQSFIEIHNNHAGTGNGFWKQVSDHTDLKNSKNLDQLQAVFHLTRLTGNDLPLTEEIVKSANIKSPADIKRLAAYDRSDWEAMLKNGKSKSAAASFKPEKPGKGLPGSTQNAAALLESTFAKAFPTAAFAARLAKDPKSKIPQRDKISKFLQENEHFDLLHTRVSQFMQENKKNISEQDALEMADQLRRTQRVFKLAPTYEATHALLSDNIHSAHHIYKMGQDNFVKTYSDKLGEQEATQVFQKASQIHAASVALAGNLRSLADASTLNAFPDFQQTLSATLAQELPSLETLFGHTDFFDTAESKSVYGAPAYLTDILHFLDNRISTLPITARQGGDRVPTVKDLLLRRRPDIADIDLESNNTNTEIPYIDIACEIMEDYIAAPSINVASSTNLSLLVEGPISATLSAAVKAAFVAAGQTNISNLMTAGATVSEPYTVNHLQADNTYLSQKHWVIRDTYLTLRASFTTGATTIEFRVLHQTQLPTEAINAGPEHINTTVYNNFLKTAKKPFSLPFDLFETEGELYLEKLGVKKADLLNTFRKEDKLAPGTSPADLGAAYASLGINEAEQTLIFVADPTHQSLYWGTAASSTAIQVDLFEKLTGLNYTQVSNLIQLQFINPAKDSKIEHDDLSADTTKQRITNITTTKLDAIHRFLRLWRKTRFTMDELDAIIMSSVIGQGKIINKLAWQLQQFTWLQQKLQVNAFQLLAFYQNLDISHNLPDCLYNQLFQNSAITNPVSPNFSIVAATPGTLAINPPDKAVIAAVLQISIDDVTALIAKTISRIAFSSLSLMYRHSQLAKSLGLSISELLILQNLIDANPFLDLQSTYLFIQKYELLKSSGLSTDDLNYVLRHQDNSSQSIIPANSQVLLNLGQLQDELLAAEVATQPAADLNGTLLTKWLSDPAFKWDSGLLSKLVDMLNTVDDVEYQTRIDDNSNFLLNLRAQYHDSVLTANLAGLPLSLNSTAIEFPTSIASQLSYDAGKRQLRLVGYMSQADRDALLALIPTESTIDTSGGPAGTSGTVDPNVIPYQNAIAFLFNAAQQTDSTGGNLFFANVTEINNNLKSLLSDKLADRFALFINKLSPVYRKLTQQALLVKNISTWFTVDKKIASQLLSSVPAVFNDFTDPNFVHKVAGTDPAAPYPVQSTRYQFVAKTCFVAGKLKLTDVNLAFLLPHAADISSLNFTALPLTPVTTAVTTFTSFENLVNLLKLEQYYPTKITDSVSNTSISIYSILLDAINLGSTPTTDQLAAYKTKLVSDLVSLTGWNQADLTALIITPNYITITLPGDIKSIPVLLRLHKRFVMLRQLGVPAVDAMVNWNKASLTFDDAAKIKQVLKLRYSSSDWEAITTPIQNTLREKKRDALIAYLLANPGTQTWKDTNDLYSFFLLDVEMGSCQPTSRIVEATNAVQLFVQRCFLGLEPSIVVDSKSDSDWLQWKWMKNFRVWQANVKVFLYPENWIEPELLPEEIKSPFLKDLETELLQNEVTAINVENAFHNYLEKLEAVARLEVKGMWYDHPSKTLHVFARTYGGNPRIYYHRELIEDRRWTPWKKIDLDIVSDHIMPAVYNNRLYLFWAVFTENAGEGTDNVIIPAPSTNGSYTIPVGGPKKNWQIQLAFSEYKNGKWTPKKISENNETGQIVVKQSDFPDKTKFLFCALDIPAFDYGKIFVPNDPNHTQIDTVEEFNKKAAVSLRQNGKLVISCYYYNFVANDSFDNCKYVDSFQLDPVKGYPAKLSVNYKVQLTQSNRRIERSNRQSTMVNMIDAETFTDPNSVAPPTNGIPGSGPGGQILVSDQAGGAFGNLIPMQMDLNDRFNYINNIYNNTFSGSFQFQVQIGPNLPYFYQDLKRNYYIVNEFSNNGAYEFLYSDFLDATFTYLEKGADAYSAIFAGIPLDVPQVFISRYFNFHHPLVDYFIRRLFAKGIDGLMERETQLKGDIGYDNDPNKFDFQTYFQPVIAGFDSIYSGANLPPVIHNGVTDSTPGYPKDDVDFNLQSGYGLYNWELFFHAPLMIAERLSQNHQFEEADRWYKYIFNPTDTSTQEAPSKYWNTKPFFFNTSADYVQQRIDNILKGINSDPNALDLIKDVEDWRNNPFQPHFIAQSRIVAYQKVAVMKYIGHLIRHGDFLFSQHSMESVNEATQLYILAAEILGPKPQVIPFVGKTAVDNYYQLEEKLDTLSNALVDIENLLPGHSVVGYNGVNPTTPGLPSLQTLYFGVPMNENLAGPTGYWDLVADRLFKIRHCLDIDGNLAPISLFSAPIDPGMLVRAASAGLDIGTILSDVNAPLPLYRFGVMIQKASELVNEVKSLGAAMLSALQNKDAEAMALLRSGHEIKLQNAVLLIKQKQIQDAQTSLDALKKQKELVAVRQKYYSGLINVGLSDGEIAALELNYGSAAIQASIAVMYALAGGLDAIPDFHLGASGFGGTPHVVAEDGGTKFANTVENFAQTLSFIAGGLDRVAAIINTHTNYNRRADEWKFQLDLASKELELIDKQIEGAQIRLDIANQDLSNQQLQIDQAKEMDEFMRSKFTNVELYNWMSTQLSNTYFKSYQLAYDVAKKAERCFRYELGLSDSAYINFGYWDSLKKGLLAGEQLSYDLRKMEMAFIDENKRELELTKHISLSQLDPVALLKLKTTGECWINLPEELFDMDYPGHYMRRIKSVSLTIPCITGPYTTVSCTLTMTKNSVRTSALAGGDYPRKQTNGIPADDPRFRDSLGALQSIATSSAQNDSGLFELNFRDDRYLPFEGAGAISLWHLQLPAAVRQFDYNTISDVIVHLRYTARDGGAILKTNAATSLNNRINQMLVSLNDRGLRRILSAKNDLPTEWYRFLHPVNSTEDQVLTVNLDNNRFPLFVQGKSIKITGIELVADSSTAPINGLQVLSPSATADSLSLTATAKYGSFLSGSISYSSSQKDPGTWLIKNPVANSRLTDGIVNNLVIIVTYEVH